jgi:hypothetical protein
MTKSTRIARPQPSRRTAAPDTPGAGAPSPSGREEPSAPLFGDCFALAEWLLGRIGNDSGVLATAICKTALDLLDAVTLALKDRERTARLRVADERLISLRVKLRLAAETGLLADNQMLHVLDIAHRIGRQLGGWQRSRDSSGVARS